MDEYGLPFIRIRVKRDNADSDQLGSVDDRSRDTVIIYDPGARRHGCPGNWSTQILGAATVRLAAYSPITPYIEFASAEVYDSPVRRELHSAGFPVRSGVIDLPHALGNGFDLTQGIVDAFV